MSFIEDKILSFIAKLKKPIRQEHYRNIMRFRSNRQLEHSEDYLTKKLTEIDSTNDKGARQQHHHQTALFLVDKNTANNQTMSKGGVGISGLNNLGNTCFFNSVLQNLAQTQLLEELLNEILTGPCPSKLSIKHHEDYDSDLTDCDEAEIVAEKTGDLNRTTQNGEDSERSKKSSVTKEAKVHRSIRVKDVDLVVREGPGLLTRRLHETIKNIRSANSNVVNPNNLFTSVCKKVPSFKGYQQQDSHELLRNLLDAVKCEELKRRQTAILESFSIQNPKNIDELTKMKIKRYGRLSSYTVIDNLFGGHLLSSIICQECRSCVVRLEPILDLSLPIVDDDSLEFESNKRDLPGRSCKAKGKANNTPVKPASSPTPLSKEAAAFKKSDPVSPDNSKLSKHQLKKMKKDSKKTKRKDKKGGKGKNDEDEEETTTTTTTATKESTAESQEPTVEENSTIEDKLAKLELNGEEESSNQNEAQHLINNEETSEENSQREMNGGGKEEKSNEEEKPLLNGVNEDNEEEENDEVSQEGQRSLNSLKLEAMKRLGAATAIDEHMTGLEQCLARFTSVEMLSDRITCDRCSSRARTKTYTHATKQYLLGELPAILTIHLKRFQQHGMHLAKSNKYVSFPAMLDMSPYASKICHGVRENQRPIYRLYGVVEHSGRLNSGHYTAYVRVLEDEKDNNNSDETTRQRITRLFLSEHRLCNFNKLLNSSTSTSKTISNKIEAGAEKWFYVSDSHVKEANLAQVLKSQAYLLFYERIQ